MKGKLLLPGGLSAVVEKGQWHSSSRLLQEMLQTRFPIGGSPAEGDPVAKVLHDAARALRGRLKLGTPEPAEEGRVY